MGEIRNRFTNKVIFTYEGPLRSVNLRKTDFTDFQEANLQEADLQEADLRKVDLWRANLQGADLEGADLYRAELQIANLEEANLRDANLQKANLWGADLQDADLEGANLQETDLREAKNVPEAYVNLCKDDFVKTVNLLKQNGEVEYLKKALIEGRINGTQYQGRCACLVGSIANFQETDYGLMCQRAGYNRGLNNSAEQWFFQIRVGNTPEDSFFAKKAVEWCDKLLSQGS